MRARFLLLSLLAAALPVQEEARIRGLITKLDDDSFEVREKAEQELVAIGEAAVPLLRTAVAEAERRKDQAEIRVRALSAIDAIEFAAKARRFFAEPRLITLRCPEAEIGQVLSDLERQTGVKCDVSRIDAKAKVSIDAVNAPLFKVLDGLCLGQEERSYEYRDEGVRFHRSRFVPCPSAYEGPFRIRAVKLKQERSTDFKTSDAQVQLSLAADWERYLKPSRRVVLEVRKATDDKGGALEVGTAEEVDDGNGGRIVIGGRRILMRLGGAVMVAAAADEEAAHFFTLKGLSPGATRITVQGLAQFMFPLEKKDVVFENPGADEPQQAGDVALALRSQGSGRAWRLTLSQTPGRPLVRPQDMDGRIDRESVVALDEAGKEHQGTLSDAGSREEMQMVMLGREVPAGTPLATFQAVFPTLQNRLPKKIRFKFVSQVFVKSVPFTLADIALP